MKKCTKSLGVIAVGAALVVSSINTNAQEIITIDFSTASGYANGDLEGQPSGSSNVWYPGEPDGFTDRFQIENEQLVQTDFPDGNQWIVIDIPVQQGQFTTTFDWQYLGAPDAVVDFGFTLSDSANFGLDGNPNVTFNECGAMIRMNRDPDLDVRNGDWEGGGGYESLVPYSYQDGAKISVRLEVDTEALLFDAYVTKEGEDEVMIADDYGFRRITSDATNGLNCIAIWSGDVDGDEQAVLDNIALFGSASVSEWAIH